MARNGGNGGKGKAVALSEGHRPVRSVKEFLTICEGRSDQFEKALARHITPERLFRVAQVAISKQPRLLRCTRESMLLALMEAGQVGLEPSGVQGHAALVPYRSRHLSEKAGEDIYIAEFQPMYRGLIALARRSGDVGSIEARVVFRGDDFEVRHGTDQLLRHVPRFEADTDEEITHFYALARFLDGTPPQFEVMTRDQVDAVRGRSKADEYGDSPWQTDYGEMGRKTVVKRLTKYLPSSTELDAVIAKDNAVEYGDGPTRLRDLDPNFGEVSEDTVRRAEAEAGKDASQTKVDELERRIS